MTWARLDDRTHSRPEWVKLSDAALNRAALAKPTPAPAVLLEEARVAAQRAKAVHLASLMYAVPALTDGRITPADIEQICAIGSFTATEWYDGADLLVSTGAWRRIKSTKRDPLGGFEMLLGWAPGEQPLRADETDRRRRSALRDALREGGKDYPNRLLAEARSEGLCEYCDTPIAKGGQLDHVDPTNLTNALENLAHTCAKCNRRKGLHTLTAAGMSFTPRAEKARQQAREQGR